MKTVAYQTKDFLLVRKPHGIPSTFGQEESFLDILKKHLTEPCVQSVGLEDVLDPSLQIVPIPRSSEFVQVANLDAILREQVDRFGQEEEYGLVNRLDNDTAGFLYFVRSAQAKNKFLQFQKSWHIHKYYLAQVHGNGESQTIDNPIMHHKTQAEKMIVIKKPDTTVLWRAKPHYVHTRIENVHYDPQTNISTLLVTIDKGIRHQIRVHLASIWYPIIGDSLYGKKGPHLHLWSIGFDLQ